MNKEGPVVKNLNVLPDEMEKKSKFYTIEFKKDDFVLLTKILGNGQSEINDGEQLPGILLGEIKIGKTINTTKMNTSIVTDIFPSVSVVMVRTDNGSMYLIEKYKDEYFRNENVDENK